MNLKLNQKLMVGYLFIIVIPVAFFSLTLYSLNYRSAKEVYLNTQKQEIANFDSQFSALLEQLSNYSYFFQNDQKILAYLSGEYGTTSDILFYYLGSMADTFRCAATDSRVLGLTVYGYRDYALTISGKLESMRDFPMDQDAVTQIDHNIDGIWIWDADGSLAYYRTLYNDTSQFRLGILKIDVNVDEILRQLTANLSYSWYFSPADGESIFLFDGQTLRECTFAEREELLEDDSPCFVHEMKIVSGQLFQPVVQIDYLKTHFFFYIILTVCLLLLYSLLYFGISRSMVSRLVDFGRFISDQEAKNLTVYECVHYTDEIGMTITVYNQLIGRINDLIHNNYEVSLKMKEARYYALQAQIKPHFLYNILENIQMSSVSHDDMETAKMTATFGKYLRYSMDSSTGATALEKELQSAKVWLEVNRIRLGEMLTFEMSVRTELDELYCPRFVLQPLLENSIKHGMKKDTPLSVSFDIYGDDDEFSHVVYVQIRDNGNGIEPERLAVIQDILYYDRPRPSSRHVGLRNVNDRLKAFHPQHQGLLIDCPPEGGTRIRFSLIRGNTGNFM